MAVTAAAVARPSDRGGSAGPRDDVNRDRDGMGDAVAWYDDHAETVAALYEKGTFEAVHGWLVDLLPSCPATVLDIGAGSGRDAVWLAARGYDVVAVEPSRAMRSAASRLHPDAPVRWMDDRLPGLDVVAQFGASFDLILLSAVWMHVPARDRPQAFRALTGLLKPGGILAMNFRDGPPHRKSGIHRVSLAEVEALAQDYGALAERRSEASYRLGRNDVRWIQVAIRFPGNSYSGTSMAPSGASRTIT